MFFLQCMRLAITMRLEVMLIKVQFLSDLYIFAHKSQFSGEMRLNCKKKHRKKSKKSEKTEKNR